MVYRLVLIQMMIDDKSAAPLFSGQYHGHDLHTHAPINHLVYHLGLCAFQENNCFAYLMLIAAHASAWVVYNKAAAKEALKKMKLKILGGKMPKEAQKK